MYEICKSSPINLVGEIMQSFGWKSFNLRNSRNMNEVVSSQTRMVNIYLDTQFNQLRKLLFDV